MLMQLYALKINLSFISANVHAIQWNDTYGEIETRDPTTGKILTNIEITDISPYQAAINSWNTANTAFYKSKANTA